MNVETMIELPLVHDNHSHVTLYAAFEGIPDIGGLGKSEALTLIGALPRATLSIVKGWRTDRLRIGAEDVEAMPPVVIVNASLHGFIASPAALGPVARIWPELAESAGDPGWGERNLPGLFAFYERVAGLDEAKLKSFMSRMEALGIGSLDDMTVSGDESFALLGRSGVAGRIRGWASIAAYRRLSPASRALCSGIKLFLDGSLGARSAALDASFLEGGEGSLLYSDDELEGILAEIASYGTRLSAHAIGHRAIEQALRCMERLGRTGIHFEAPRLEHAQFVSRDQARRCRDMGIALSMQPNFNYDSIDYADRLIHRHKAENDPFRMLIDDAGFVPGKDLIFGSDGMPHGPAEALTQSLFPAFEGQMLTPRELAAGYGEALGASSGAGDGDGDGDGKLLAYEVDRRARKVFLSPTR